MRRTIFAIIAMAWATGAAAAAPLPLGFDALHWGMSRQQLIDALPLLHSVPPSPPQGSSATGIVARGYAWHDCQFVVTFELASDALVDLKAVQSDASQACRDDALAAFSDAYGAPQVKSTMGFNHYSWPGDGATTPVLNLVDKGLVAPGFGVNAHLHEMRAPDSGKPAIVARPLVADFPLGLDKLHLYMSPEDIRAISLFFAQLPPIALNSFNPEGKIVGYRWQDCTFDMQLAFGSSGLDLIVLKQVDPSPSCIAASRTALIARFGEPAHFERNGVIADDYPYKDGAAGKLDFYPTPGTQVSGLMISFYLPAPVAISPRRPSPKPAQ